MGIKPTIEIIPPRALSVAPSNAATVPTPQHMATVPAPLSVPSTTWGAKRQTRYYRAMQDLSDAQSGYLRSRAELAKSFVAAARAANEVAELPEICANDTQVRELKRERDYLDARREVEEARYGLLATMNEVDKMRKPRMKKVAGKNAAAIDALMKSKVDMEAVGEDTTDIDRTLSMLQEAQP
jgi:hypothetical protein